MKKRFITITSLVVTLLFTVSQLTSNPTGAPAKAAGGPAEGGATCSQGGCHNGAATAVTNVITTDIPAGGYKHDSTYNITVTFTGSGQKGFMVSVQSATGTYLGTLISGTSSKVAFTNYITHTSAQFGSTATWNFKWKAPAAGTGDVTFYGAFAATRNTTTKQSVTFKENTTTGIESIKDVLSVNIAPNPVAEKLNMTFALPQSNNVVISLVSLDGKMSNMLFDGELSAGNQSQQFDISNIKEGVYFVQIKTDVATSIRKIYITK